MRKVGFGEDSGASKIHKIATMQNPRTHQDSGGGSRKYPAMAPAIARTYRRSSIGCMLGFGSGEKEIKEPSFGIAHRLRVALKIDDGDRVAFRHGPMGKAIDIGNAKNKIPATNVLRERARRDA